MTDQIKIFIDRDVYERLQLLMVPPINDANAVIKERLYHDGRASRAAVAAGIAEQHYVYAQELERPIQGAYNSGGNT